jgi:hypothetical protein
MIGYRAGAEYAHAAQSSLRRRFFLAFLNLCVLSLAVMPIVRAPPGSN